MQILKPERPQTFKPYIGSEDQFQISAAQYLDMRGLFWFHCPNGGLRNKGEAAKFKRMGVKPGVSDCLILEKRKGFAGFFIELKVGTNKPTESQLSFLSHAKKMGYKTLITWSLDELIFEVENYLS